MASSSAKQRVIRTTCAGEQLEDSPQQHRAEHDVDADARRRVVASSKVALPCVVRAGAATRAARERADLCRAIQVESASRRRRSFVLTAKVSSGRVRRIK